MEFHVINENEAKLILVDALSYADNNRINLSVFYDVFNDNFSYEKIWYGCFENGKCMALSVLKDIRGDGILLLACFQSFIKGYGKPLLFDILSKTDNIWWCADPAGGKNLVNYYRQFPVKEYFIHMSKWTQSPEYAFYKADSQHEPEIIDILNKADMANSQF